MNWRFAYRPLWLFGHLVVVAVVALFLNLAFWQLDRLDERKDQNEAARFAASLPELQLSAGLPEEPANEFRRAVVRGTPDESANVYVRFPLYQGRIGYYVLTPFVLADGSAVVVNRGWVPTEDAGDDARGPVPGTVRSVTGLIRSPTVAKGGIAGTTGSPPVPTITAVDVERLRPLMGDRNLAPFWLQETRDAEPSQPMPLEGPEFDEGPHFSYALQWFGFAAVGVVGWFVLLFRAAKEETNSSAQASGLST